MGGGEGKQVPSPGSPLVALQADIFKSQPRERRGGALLQTASLSKLQPLKGVGDK